MQQTALKSLGAGLVSVALLALPHARAQAQSVELLVQHTTVATGADGIPRSTEFSERLTRTSTWMRPPRRAGFPVRQMAMWCSSWCPMTTRFWLL